MFKNSWQKVYVKNFLGGKMPKTKIEKEKFEYLGMVGRYVLVDTGKDKMKYAVNESKCDMSNGIISVDVLASNLIFWLRSGYRVSTSNR